MQAHKAQGNADDGHHFGDAQLLPEDHAFAQQPFPFLESPQHAQDPTLAAEPVGDLAPTAAC